MIQENMSPASKSAFGFWVYLMTDLVLFATLFATYAVLRDSTFNGPDGSEIFDMPFVLVETLLLLTSSFTVGLAVIAARLSKRKLAIYALGITFLLGIAFIGMEIYEFKNLYSEGNSWRTSAFLSAFFTLVGTHGLHISAGLLWMGLMIVTLFKRGINSISLKRLVLLSMFWHFLDIVWIFIFTFVYALGVA